MNSKGAAHSVGNDTLAGLFERQTERTPEAVAVRFGDETMTYRSLDERSNELAAALTQAGTGPESRVGVCLERSLELMVALLGTLKAGAAFVPLDPGYPSKRLAAMQADAGVRAIITSQALLSLVPAAGTVLCLGPGSQGTSPDRPGVVVHPASLAYVIFTSGSTGRPKGAMNTHEAVVNRLKWMQGSYPLDGSDKVLQKTPISFDVSVWELFWPLAVGATLVMAQPGEHRDPHRLAAAITEHGITTVHFVPSMLRIFLEDPSVERCAGSLRRVFCSGEALSPDLVDRFYQCHIAPELHNLYGPTEAAIDVTSFPCPPEAAAKAAIPIGTPIANASAFVLGDRLELKAADEEGELYLGGLPLARGYVGQPGLTAERFVPSPFGCGERLYRTGDLARCRADGVLEYLGRADDQVKIRGMRVELGEIELALAGCEPVSHAAVVVRADWPGDQQLVAYLVARAGGTVDRATVRDGLAAKLPDYMVPAWYVVLDSLPMTLNGKLDRRALPAPARGDAVQDSSGAPLSGPVEHLLAGMWSELLSVSPVWADDNFFALGGQSLTAARVVFNLRKALGIEVPVGLIFDNPTLHDAAQVIEDQLQAELAASSGTKPVPRMDDPIVSLPAGRQLASFGQQRLWFLDRLTPNSPLYNLPLALDVAGLLDVNALVAALDAVVARHSALRTHFEAGELHQVWQVIEPDCTMPFTLDDLTGLTHAEQERAVSEAASAEALRAFDLGRGPLARARLLRLADERSVLLLTMHHMVSDAWSTGILIRELADCYRAAHRGEPADAALAPLAIQYADFAAWQRRYLEGGIADAQLAYWRDRLAGAPASLEIVTDRTRPAVPRHAGDSFTFTLERTTTDKLTELSRASGTTRFMILLVVFQLLLGRYADAKDVSVGVPVAGRSRPETDDLIGFFVNTLVLRTRWEDEPSFTELLARVRDETLAAFQHQDVPFEQVVDALRPARDLSRSPLFQVLFAMDNLPVSMDVLPGLSFVERESPGIVAKFDLTVAWEDTPRQTGELHGSVDYDVSLFDRQTVADMMRHYHALLESALASPETSVSWLGLTTPGECAALTEWGTGDELDRPDSIVDAFYSQADASPSAVALLLGAEPVTYADLRGQSEDLAALLAARGVTPESVVGLAMRRSAALVTAMLAVLMSGAAYLLLDPEQPGSRLEFMVADSGAVVVLTDHEPAFASPVPVVAVTELAALAASAPERRQFKPRSAVHRDQRACVYYTSGSTGRPKGAEITHRAIVRLVYQTAYLDIRSSDVVPQVHSTSFDPATVEIWGTLLNGARLVWLGRDQAPTPASLRAAIAEHGVTVAHLPASLVHQCVDADPGMFAPLRAVFFGGEPADPRRLATLRRMLPGLRQVNAYGPTEATSTASTYDVRTGVLDTSRVPIGTPIPETRIYVLDEYGRQTGVGLPGEIYIGGGGLARGYIGRPDLTAERFVPNPFATGARLYRTGDRARWRADGALEFLGRADGQVKIRGVRVEPAEVESILATCPGVTAAVVEACGSGESRYLVAYIVPDGSQPAGPLELRAYLSARVPAAMVPARYLILAELPRTANGKVDRSALPAPADRDGLPVGVYVAPRSQAEKLVAQTWGKLLTLSTVSVNDNFFELGGHSLMAMRGAGQLGEALGIEVPVSVFFDSPTLADMAAALEDRLITALEAMSDEQARTFLAN